MKAWVTHMLPSLKGQRRSQYRHGNTLRHRAYVWENLWITELRRFPHGVIHQCLAERPDRAGDLVTGGDDGIERGLDPAAVFFGDGQRRQQFNGVAGVSGDLGEDLVILEQRNGDE